MAGEQSQFEGLLQNLLSTDNKIRVEAEVRELRVSCNISVLCRYTVFVSISGFLLNVYTHVVFTARCIYTSKHYSASREGADSMTSNMAPRTS